MKIAIVGGGVAGNVAAHLLHGRHSITLFEAAAYLGGHTHTHRVAQAGRTYHVDTGFIVFNRRNYPSFNALLDQLGVVSQETQMSFSVRDERTGLEYNGTRLNTLFAQRRNLLRPSFLGMVADILRFNRQAPAILAGAAGEMPLAELLERGRFGRAFIDQYLVPMGASIWSTDPERMMSFPARFFVRFLHNHGMLSLTDRPVWRTICGGSARYVEKLAAPFRDRVRLSTPVESVTRSTGGVRVKARGQLAEAFDKVFLACHSDQALALLADASPAETEVLSAIPYQRNEAILHTDARIMPRRRLAWAAWNYHLLRDRSGPVALTYNMNILQRLDAPEPFLVTLNRTDAIDPGRIIERLTYHHPLFTPASIAAQGRQREINGANHTYFCGAYWRNGFHEDGVISAAQAVDHLDQDQAPDAKRPLLRPA